MKIREPFNLKGKTVYITENGDIMVRHPKVGKILVSVSGQYLRQYVPEAEPQEKPLIRMKVLSTLWIKWGSRYKNKWRYLCTLPTGQFILSRLGEKPERRNNGLYRVPEFLVTVDMARLSAENSLIYTEAARDTMFTNVDGNYPHIIDVVETSTIEEYARYVGSLQELQTSQVLDNWDVMYIINFTYGNKLSVFEYMGTLYPSVCCGIRIN